MPAIATWCVSACVAFSIAAGTAAAQPAEKIRQIEEGYVTTPDGSRLYYQKVGDAPQVVIQPGRLFAFTDFEWLGEHFTLISYVMRNRGRSDLELDDAKISFEQDVADLETVRNHFGVRRSALLGYSYLGKIIVLYALEHPEHVERIVQFGAVGPSFATEYRPEYVFQDDPVEPAARARLRALRNEQNYHLTHPREYCEQEWDIAQRPSLVGDPSKADRVRIDVCDMPNEWPILQMRHLRLHFQESGMTHVTPLDRVRQLKTPVLTIHGTHDRNAPYGAGREWSYLLPEARLLTIEGAGHHVFAEASEVVMPAVLEFLRDNWPKDAVKVTDDPRK
ncbi:MAG: alpha/beta fold hydrolase [Steroidobacteraceae bacterium]